MRRVIVAAAAAAALAIPAAAVADSCVNVSRAPAPCGMTCTDGPVTDGNWVWLPSIGVPFPAWGKAPPGTDDSVALDLPGANGNYTDGKTSSLLGVSAICLGRGNAQVARQNDHGIQSGCE